MADGRRHLGLVGPGRRPALGGSYRRPGHLAGQGHLIPGHQPVPPWQPARGRSPRLVASLAEITRIYGIRRWNEQSYEQVKDELGWADFEVHSDAAIRRHQVLVNCAFGFYWDAWFHDPPAPHQPVAPRPGPSSGESCAARRPSPASASVAAAARDMRLASPWIAPQRWWPAWSTAPRRRSQALINSVAAGCGLHLYIPN
jgi:hypothetical protein